MRSSDSDMRYMALNDVINECRHEPYILMTEATESQLVSSVLGLVTDPHSEAKNMSIKALAALTHRVRDEQVQIMIERLVETINAEEEESRDIASLGLKTLTAEVRSDTSLPNVFCTRIVPKLLDYVRDKQKSSQELIIDSLGTVSEIISRFPNHIAANISLQAQILQSSLPYLRHSHSALRERTLAVLGVLGPSCASETFTQLTKDASEVLDPASAEVSRTAIQLIDTLARTAPRHLGPAMPQFMPRIINMAKVDDADLREVVLQALETILLSCPAEVAPFVTQIIGCCVALLKHGVNYIVDDSEDEDGDRMDVDQDGDDGDQDDMSWKVRRTAVKVLTTVIKTRSETLLSISQTIAPALIERFSDPEESTRVEILQAFVSLLKQIDSVGGAAQTFETPTGTPKRKLQDRNTEDDNSITGQLTALVSDIWKKLSKKLESKSLETRASGLAVLRDLVNVLDGTLDAQVPSLVGQIERTLRNTDVNHGPSASLKGDIVVVGSLEGEECSETVGESAANGIGSNIRLSDGRSIVDVPINHFTSTFPDTPSITGDDPTFAYAVKMSANLHVDDAAVDQIVDVFTKRFVPFLQGVQIFPHFPLAASFIKRLQPNKTLEEHLKNPSVEPVTRAGSYLLHCTSHGKAIDFKSLGNEELWAHEGEGIYVLLALDGDGMARGVYVGESCDAVGRVTSHLTNIKIAGDIQRRGVSPPHLFNPQLPHLEISKNGYRVLPVLIATGMRALYEPLFSFALGSFWSPAMASLRSLFLPPPVYGQGYNKTASMENRKWFEPTLANRMQLSKMSAFDESIQSLTTAARLQMSGKVPIYFMLDGENNAYFTQVGGNVDRIGLPQEYTLLRQLAGEEVRSHQDFPVPSISASDGLGPELSRLKSKLGITSQTKMPGHLHAMKKGGLFFAALLGERPELEGLGLGVSWEWKGVEACVQLLRVKKGSAGHEKEERLADLVWSALTESERKERLTEPTDDLLARRRAAANTERPVAGFIRGSHKVTLTHRQVESGLRREIKFFLPPPLQHAILGLAEDRLPPSVAELPHNTALYMRVGSGALPPGEQHSFSTTADRNDFAAIPIELKTTTPGGKWVRVFHGPTINRNISLRSKSREHIWRPLAEASRLLSSSGAPSSSSSGEPLPSDVGLMELSKGAFPVESARVSYRNTNGTIMITITPSRFRWGKRLTKWAGKLNIPLEMPNKANKGGIFLDIKIVPAKEMKDVALFAKVRGTTSTWLKIISGEEDQWTSTFCAGYLNRIKEYEKATGVKVALPKAC
ncbi:hypothetical protein CF326_g2581 [Tilletia indica]|nr:hypothetical protein CF326_g2581 [Tilletia indica]